MGGLLAGFRLLEAAGACEVVGAAEAEGSPHIASSQRWWTGVGSVARSYRTAIFDAATGGFPAFAQWERNCTYGDSALFRRETSRLLREHEQWLVVVPGGRSYTAWLAAYVATAELDGARALDSLRTSTAIAAEFADIPWVEGGRSVYEQLQVAADVLLEFLPLRQHPLTDMRRFAFVPHTLLAIGG